MCGSGEGAEEASSDPRGVAENSSEPGHSLDANREGSSGSGTRFVDLVVAVVVHAVSDTAKRSSHPRVRLDVGRPLLGRRPLGTLPFGMAPKLLTDLDAPGKPAAPALREPLLVLLLGNDTPVACDECPDVLRPHDPTVSETGRNGEPVVGPPSPDVAAAASTPSGIRRTLLPKAP